MAESFRYPQAVLRGVVIWFFSASTGAAFWARVAAALLVLHVARSIFDEDTPRRPPVAARPAPPASAYYYPSGRPYPTANDYWGGGQAPARPTRYIGPDSTAASDASVDWLNSVKGAEQRHNVRESIYSNSLWSNPYAIRPPD